MVDRRPATSSPPNCRHRHRHHYHHISLLLVVVFLSSWPPPCHMSIATAPDYRPWSPIVRGRPLRPPVIPTAVLQVGVGGGAGPVIPVRDLEEPPTAPAAAGRNDDFVADNTLFSAPPSDPTGEDGRPPVRRYRRRHWRPIRRRRPYAGYYYPYNQYRRSYNNVVVPRRPEAIIAATGGADFRGGASGSGYRQARGSPRVMVEEERGFMADLRSLFGAPAHCLEGGVQYSCTLAPVCWLTGGIVTEGIQYGA